MQFNKQAKDGCRFVADAARITDKNASSDDRKHTSGGVFVAVDSNLGAVIGTEEGAAETAWVNVRGHMRVFSVYFWHTEGWTPRNEALLEAVVKQAKATRHPWLIARDATMSPEDFEKIMWFPSRLMFILAPKEASRCRSKGPKGEWIERTFDYIIASHSLRGKYTVGGGGRLLPGFSGGRLPVRSRGEKGREKEEEEEDSRERHGRNESA